ncbi:MAG: HAMP domain-containing histidine kinase [Hyphomonadaceae bacterium]|nr:HAMP domain-containing histidine kinase [Hyphomonadaceae bacterium]
MSSERLDRLFASTSFRLSAIYAALLIAAFVIAGLGAWTATRNAAEHEVRERVQLEMDALLHEMRVEGTPAAIAAIRARAHIPGSLDYRLADAGGRVLIGDLDLAPHKGWAAIDLPNADGDSRRSDDFLVLTRATPDGGLLSIGDDLERAELVRNAVLGALFWVGMGALLATLAAGFVVTRRTLKRVDALTGVVAEAAAGNLFARAPGDRGDDDLARLSRGVNAMLEQIDALVASVRRVSTDIAHDLRTPLTHLRQELETAGAAATPAAAAAAIAGAQAKVDEVLRLFEAILRLSEIEAGAARARFAPVDLASIVERVSDAYRLDVEESGRTLHVGPLIAAEIEGDADLLAQALANLIENAMRHTPRGAAIKIGLRADQEAVRLSIEDDGPGVPESDRVRVLAPFMRLDRSRSTPGAGLGLSLVNAIATLHGASISLECANPGLRAVFRWDGRARR